MEKEALIVRIEARRLPGATFGAYKDVRVGLQVRKEVVQLVPGDARSARWETEIAVVPGASGLSFRGPAVHGPVGEKFLYLSWVAREGRKDQMFRRAKLQFDAVPAKDVRRAIAAGKSLVAHLDLTDAKGGPLCASVRPPRIEWSVG